MPSRKRAKRSYSRRFFWLLMLIVVAVLAYTGAWYYAANLLETRTAALISGLNGDQRRASCEEPSARGYPFRIGLFCRSVFYEDAENGISLSAGNFRSAAQIYQPLRTVGELDGPARIALPFMPAALKASWQNMRLSARLTEKLPQRVSSEAQKLVLVSDEATAEPIAEADTLQTHMRRNEADLDVAIVTSRLSLAPGITGDVAIPPLTGELLLSIDDGVTLLGERALQLRGRSGTIQSLSVKAADSEAGMTLAGPVEIGTDGLISAQFKVTLREPRAIAQLAAQAFPERRDQIQSVMAALSSLGAAPTLPVTIRRGRVSIGFLPLGDIPPVQ